MPNDNNPTLAPDDSTFVDIVGSRLAWLLQGGGLFGETEGQRLARTQRQIAQSTAFQSQVQQRQEAAAMELQRSAPIYASLGRMLGAERHALAMANAFRTRRVSLPDDPSHNQLEAQTYNSESEVRRIWEQEIGAIRQELVGLAANPASRNERIARYYEILGRSNYQLDRGTAAAAFNANAAAITLELIDQSPEAAEQRLRQLEQDRRRRFISTLYPSGASAAQVETHEQRVRQASRDVAAARAGSQAGGPNASDIVAEMWNSIADFFANLVRTPQGGLRPWGFIGAAGLGMAGLFFGGPGLALLGAGFGFLGGGLLDPLVRSMFTSNEQVIPPGAANSSPNQNSVATVLAGRDLITLSGIVPHATSGWNNAALDARVYLYSPEGHRITGNSATEGVDYKTSGLIFTRRTANGQTQQLRGHMIVRREGSSLRVREFVAENGTRIDLSSNPDLVFSLNQGDNPINLLDSSILNDSWSGITTDQQWALGRGVLAFAMMQAPADAIARAMQRAPQVAPQAPAVGNNHPGVPSTPPRPQVSSTPPAVTAPAAGPAAPSATPQPATGNNPLVTLHYIVPIRGTWSSGGILPPVNDTLRFFYVAPRETYNNEQVTNWAGHQYAPHLHDTYRTSGLEFIVQTSDGPRLLRGHLRGRIRYNNGYQLDLSDFCDEHNHIHHIPNSARVPIRLSDLQSASFETILENIRTTIQNDTTRDSAWTQSLPRFVPAQPPSAQPSTTPTQQVCAAPPSPPSPTRQEAQEAMNSVGVLGMFGGNNLLSGVSPLMVTYTPSTTPILRVLQGNAGEYTSGPSSLACRGGNDELQIRRLFRPHEGSPYASDIIELDDNGTLTHVNLLGDQSGAGFVVRHVRLWLERARLPADVARTVPNEPYVTVDVALPSSQSFTLNAAPGGTYTVDNQVIQAAVAYALQNVDPTCRSAVAVDRSFSAASFSASTIATTAATLPANVDDRGGRARNWWESLRNLLDTSASGSAGMPGEWEQPLIPASTPVIANDRDFIRSPRVGNSGSAIV